MDYNPSGSSAHGILQARILGEPKYFPNPGIEFVSLMIPAVAVGFFTTKHHLGFPGGSDGKESACNAGDRGSIPRLGRLLQEGNSYPLQYSCLENTTDSEAWQVIVHGVTNSQGRLRD